MKSIYPLAALLSLGSLLPASAQQVAASLPVARPATMTHDDSLALLHQLFQRERHRGRIATIADGLVLPANVVSLAAGRDTDFHRGLQAANVAIFSPLLVSSIIQWTRFSKRREREAVLRFEQRQVQPLYLQRSYALALIARNNKR